MREAHRTDAARVSGLGSLHCHWVNQPWESPDPGCSPAPPGSFQNTSAQARTLETLT